MNNEYDYDYEKELADIYCYDEDENALLNAEAERNGDY